MNCRRRPGVEGRRNEAEPGVRAIAHQLIASIRTQDPLTLETALTQRARFALTAGSLQEDLHEGWLPEQQTEIASSTTLRVHG